MSTTAGRITKGGTKFVPKRKQQGPSAASARVASVTPSLAQATPRQVPQVDPSPLAHVEELALPPTPDDPLPLPPAPPSPSETFLAPAPPLPKPQPPPPPSQASGSSFGPSDPTASSSRPRQTTPPRAPSPPKPSSSASPHRLPNSSPRGRPAVPQGTAFNFGPSAPPPSRARAVSPPPPTPPAAALPTPAPTAPPPAAKAKEKEKGKKAPVASTSNAAEREGDADDREDGVDEQAAKRDAVNARRRETAKAKKEGKKPAPPPAKAAGAGAKDKGKKRALDQDALEEGGEGGGGGGGGEASGSKAKRLKKAGAGGEEKDVAGSSNDAMDVDANPSPDPDEDDDGEPRTQREIEGEAERDERDKAAKRDKANAKRRETARLKREKLAAAAAAEDREEGEDGPMLPPPPKRMRGPNKPNPKTTTSGGEEEEEEDPDALVPKKCKRRTKVGRAKPSKVDRMLFGCGASDDDDDGSVEPSNASGSDADEETGSDESDGSLEEGSDGEMRPKKKPSKKPKKGKGKGKGKVFRRKKSPERPIVDPAVTKMSDLATPRDTLGGRVSERGLELAKKVEMKKVARKEARARMRDRALRRKRGESVSDDENEGAGADDKVSLASRHPSRRASPALSTMSSVRAGSPALLDAVAAAIGRGDLDLITDLGAKEKNDEDASDEDDYGDLVETQYAPQMRIVDGELVIDDASLEIDRSAQAQDGWSGPREVIEESAKDRMVNSATWGKQVRTEKWTSEETEAFYDYLSQFGTDFEMIAGLFPTRTRRQIKAKWNKEDRLNPKGITAALMRRKNIDLVSYAKVTGQDLSGPVPEDPFEKIQLLRQDIEAKALENGEPVFGHSGTGKLKKGGKLGKGGKKGKGKEREEEGGEGSDDDGGGLGSDVDAALAGLEDEEEEEERRRLEEEAEAAAIDREIAEAEEAERLAAKRRKRA